MHNETQREAEAGGCRGGGGRQRVFVVRRTKSVSQFGSAEEQIGLQLCFSFAGRRRHEAAAAAALLRDAARG